jgi:hypothetical protein
VARTQVVLQHPPAESRRSLRRVDSQQLTVSIDVAAALDARLFAEFAAEWLKGLEVSVTNLPI